MKLMGAVLASAMVLLSSCLDGGSNTFSATQFAVCGVTDRTYQTVLNTPSGPIYSTSLEGEVVSGACYQVAYEVDTSSPENESAATRGFYMASINALSEVMKGDCQFYNVPDTVSLLDNELPLQNLAAYSQLGVYLDGHLFLGGTLSMKNDQQNQWSLYWNRSEAPTEEEGVNVYNLFMRVQKVTEGVGSSATAMTEPRAFELDDVLQAVNDSEKANNKEIFTLKINYLTAINEKDSTDLKWDSMRLSFNVTE